MSKELPFYKFTANEWLTGDIYFEDFDVQGLFISVCATYWSKDCSITLSKIKQRLSNARPEQWQCLIDGGYIKVEDDILSISFLDEQMSELSEQHKKKVEAGRKGGQASVKQRLSNAKATVKHKDIEVEVDRDIEKDKEKVIPTLDDFLAHAISRKKNVKQDEVKNKYYQWVDNGWRTLGDKQRDIVNWKSTLTNSLQYMGTEDKRRFAL